MILAQAVSDPGALSMWRALFAAIVVLGLLGALAWVVGRGRFAFGLRRNGAVAIESSCSLGERRLLLVIGVDSRRLLLGVTPEQVSLITELTPVAPATFNQVLDRTSGAVPPGPA